MLTRFIPRLKRSLPVITFGGASLSGEGGGYGFGEMSEADAEKLVRGAWEAGISVFDTAPIYGFGLSEERLGRFAPKEAVIITKSGVDWHESKRVNMTNSPEVARRMLEESLRRLRRERIDIYMIHWPDERVDIRRPLEALVKAQEEGKIQHLGLCNTTLSDLERASEICSIDVIQSELNVFNRDPFDRLGDTWRDTFSQSWGTFDKGILTGRVTHERKFAPSDARSWAPWWNKKVVKEKIDRTASLRRLLDEQNISLTSFCLHYNLNYIGVSSCLVGFKTVEDVLKVSSSLQENLMRERIEEVLVRWQN